MRTLSVCNLKGGVGKTTTVVNMAGVLAVEFNKKVLVVDNDQQGNASQFFCVFDIDASGTAEVLCMEENIRDCIRKTNNPNIDVLPANMNLAAANRELMIKSGEMPREIRLREALLEVRDEYDFAIIDNGPNLDFSFDNSLVATNDYIVPVKIDKWALYGVSFVQQRVKAMSQYWNPNINFVGCLVTMQHNNNTLEREGAEWLESGHDSTGQQRYKLLRTKIKYSPRVNDASFSSEIITVKSVRSMAAKNYRDLAAEYLRFVENN